MCKLFRRNRLRALCLHMMNTDTRNAWNVFSPTPKMKNKNNKNNYNNNMMFDRKHFSCFIYLFLDIATRCTCRILQFFAFILFGWPILTTYTHKHTFITITKCKSVWHGILNNDQIYQNQISKEREWKKKHTTRRDYIKQFCLHSFRTYMLFTRIKSLKCHCFFCDSLRTRNKRCILCSVSL